MREKEGLAQTILALLVISSSRATRKRHLLLRRSCNTYRMSILTYSFGCSFPFSLRESEG